MKGGQKPKRPIFSAYVTAKAVVDFFSRPSDREASASRLSALGIDKVYIEFYRGGLLVDEGILAEVRRSLESRGFEVCGGIATTHGDGFTERSSIGPHWVCYTSPITRENLGRAMATGAKVFDCIIVDDFLCTPCRCARCTREKGSRSWSKFRRDLITEFANSVIIDTARRVNPRVRLIIKYPQWYDRFHVFGYDVPAQSEIFDAVWVGTETRDPRFEYVYEYEAFANYTYIHSIARSKVEGAWFDYHVCFPEVYVEQAYQSVLAGSPEIILFSYFPEKFDPKDPHLGALMRERPLIESLAEELDGLERMGIEAYKPPNSDASSECYLFDYLGMLGIPLKVVASPPSSRSAILPAHARSDPEIADMVARGSYSVVLATAGLLEALPAPHVEGLFGLSRPPVRRKNLFTYRFRIRGKAENGEERVLFRSYLEPLTARVVAEAVSGRHYPILTVNRKQQSTYIAASLDTFRYMPYHGPARVTVAEPVSLPHLPQAYADTLRDLLLEPYGVKIHAPPLIGIYLFGRAEDSEITHVVFENFSDRDATISIHGVGEATVVLGDAGLEKVGQAFQLGIRGRGIVLLAVRTGR